MRGVAGSWGASAKNSLENVNGFSSNQLVFGKNVIFPVHALIHYQRSQIKKQVKI